MIQARTIPAQGKVACVVHTGNYSTLYQAYNALMSWIESNGLQMDGHIRERYLRYGAEGLGFELPPTLLTENPDDYVTELQVPVKT